MSDRNSTIDRLKGLGIVFVILGHLGTDIIGVSFWKYIYSFHMALFFFVSGYLSCGRTEKEPFLQFVTKKTKQILVPYVILFFISFLVSNTILPLLTGKSIFPVTVKWTIFLKALILSGGYLEKIPLNNFPLWYLPLSFIAVLIFWGLLKIKKQSVFYLVIVAIAISTIPIQTILPGRPAFHINILPPALVFMAIGWSLKKYGESYVQKSNTWWGLAFLTSGLIFSIFFGTTINKINSYIYFIMATISILAYYIFAKESRNAVLEFTGKNSLYIYGIHLLIKALFINAFGIRRILNQLQVNGIMIIIIEFLVVFLLTLAIVWVYFFVKKRFAASVNQKKLHPEKGERVYGS